MNNTINKNNTLIILDFDDSIFPTTWLIHNNIDLKNSYMRNLYISYFIELDNILYKLLNKLITLGDLLIITNALLEWVQLSSSILQKSKKIMEKINIISARGQYQDKFKNVNDWKKEAFKEAKSNKYINILSVGDNYYEYLALINLYNNDNKTLLKSIKFMNEPDHHVLIDQLNVLYDVIPKICNMTEHLDLKFKLKHDIILKKKH
jgi:hypothetical protein